jgi:hypothetical protein
MTRSFLFAALKPQGFCRFLPVSWLGAGLTSEPRMHAYVSALAQEALRELAGYS